MAYRIDLNNASQRITALTFDSSCTPRYRNLHKCTGVTTNNAWDNIVNSDSIPGDTALVLVINANTSSSSREGYGEIMYNIDGVECTNIIHLVQEGGQEEPHYIYITLTGNMSGRYSDYVTFVLSNGMSYQANYASTSGAFSDKRVKMDIPSGDLTITGVSVTDTVVTHMGYPAQLVSGSDTYLKDDGSYTINVI